MALVFQCFFCPNTLHEPGALLFSPPDEDDKCVKHHVCTKCYAMLLVLKGEHQ